MTPTRLDEIRERLANPSGYAPQDVTVTMLADLAYLLARLTVAEAVCEAATQHNCDKDSGVLDDTLTTWEATR